jgi:hypothetical protein
VNRLQWGLASVMGGIGTIGAFRPISEPWIRNDVEPLPDATVWDAPASV